MTMIYVETKKPIKGADKFVSGSAKNPVCTYAEALDLAKLVNLKNPFNKDTKR